MNNVMTIYSDTVYNNLRPLHANWEPAQPIELGDYGLLLGHAFQKLGNVSQRGIKIGEIIKDDVGDQKIFASGTNTNVSFHSAGTAPVGAVADAKARVDISFGSEGSVFFNAAECSYSMIADKTALGEAVMQAFDANDDRKWQREWAVVTDLVRSKSTTVAIATGTNAKVSLEAAGNIQQIDLAKAEIGLSLGTCTNVGYQVIAKAGLVPLIGLSQIQTKFWDWNPKFRPLASAFLSNRTVIDRLLVSPSVQTEAVKDLFFGQVY
jgi:hypothetical protein